MITAVGRLTDALEELTFGPETLDMADRRDRLVRILRSYVKPRLLEPTMALNLVVAGPTGSGKSTIVNTLAGMDASLTGAVRPTTGKPVIVASSASAPVRTVMGGVECDLVFAGTAALVDLHLIDTPDIDSVLVEHRNQAEKLIDEADLVVFVTSATKYADDIPWQVLRRAVSRGVRVINVLNRVGSESSGAIVDFSKRLREAGLDDTVTVIPEHRIPPGSHRLPDVTVEKLADRIVAWQSQVKAETSARVGRVLDSVVIRARELVDSFESTARDLAAFEAELADRAKTRAEEVAVSPVGFELHSPVPEKRRFWRLMRWRRRSRVSDQVMLARKNRVKETLGLDIEADLRSWLADLQAEQQLSHVVIQVRPIVASAIKGWFFYVRRMAQPLTVRDHQLTESVLIESTLAGEPTEAARLVLGDEADDLVSRSVRELRGRIEVVYAQAAASLAARQFALRGQFDTYAVERAIARVVTAAGA